MDTHFNLKLEEYYQKFIELQEKLKKSEEERFLLEMKFNQMAQIAKEEEQAHYRKLRSQYKRFLEEDKKRQDRNERIVRTLERIETKISTLSAKTDRINILRKHYQNYLATITNPNKAKLKPNVGISRERSFIKEEPLKCKQPTLFRDDYSIAETPNTQKPAYENESVKKALEKNRPNDDKIEILDRYLQSLSTQRCRDLLSEEKEAREKLIQETTLAKSNQATAIADDIMNSIYSRYYTKGEALPKELTKPIQIQKEENEKNKGRHDLDHQIENSVLEKVGDNATSLQQDGDAKVHFSFETVKENIPDQTENMKNYLRDDKKNTYDRSEAVFDKKRGSNESKVNSDFDEISQPRVDHEKATKLEENGASTKENTKMPAEDNWHKPKDQQNNENTPKEIAKAGHIDFYEQRQIEDKLPEYPSTNYIQEPHSQVVYDQSQFQANDKNIYTKNGDVDHSQDQISKTINYQGDQRFNTNEPISNSQVFHSEDNGQSVQYQEQPTFNQNGEQESNVYDNTGQPAQYEQSNQQVFYGNENPMNTNNDGQGQSVQYQEQPFNQNGQQEFNVYDKPGEDISANINTDDQGQSVLYQEAPSDQNSQQQSPVFTKTEEPVQYEQSNQQGALFYGEENPANTNNDDQGQSVQYQEQPSTAYDNTGNTVQYEESHQEETTAHTNNGDQGQSVQYQEQLYDHESTRESVQYDENGQPIQYNPQMQYDENGQAIQYDQYQNQYDEYGQLILYDQNGQRVQPQYDESGQIIPQYDENGQIIMLYDQNGQQVFGSEGLYGDNAQQYDDKGQLIYDSNNQQYYDYENQKQEAYDPNEYGQYKADNQDTYDSQLNTVDEQKGHEYEEQDHHKIETTNDVVQSEPQDVKNSEPVVDSENEKKIRGMEEEHEAPKVMDMLDTDTESAKLNTSKISNDSDFDFS